ncbi:MAG: hypothetical protein IPJ58_09680 [Ardenticatenia bacterium]|nr:hypothetical protein [Ardenticatenia bacterium]
MGVIPVDLANASAGDDAPIVGGKRRYRRTSKPKPPRTWRTRLDPFADVWESICQELARSPERTAAMVLADLQLRDPGKYGAGQFRTLQRRVKEWRQQALLMFKDPWTVLSRIFPLCFADPQDHYI